MENRVYYGQYSLRHWINLILKKNIILPDYQRHFVWNEAKVTTLIDAFRQKQFVPPVTIGAFKMEGRNQNLILDGQQRLTSILLAYLNLYPDEKIYKATIERLAADNDDGEPEEPLDNIFAWTFKILTEKGSAKEEILEKIPEGNYKRIHLDTNNNFFDEHFLGFSYLIPSTNDQKVQQRYYSSVFRNINIQGETLLPQESRASLYFLDQDLAQFFTNKFKQNYGIKGFNNESKIDFVRYLALLSQYYKDDGPDCIARSYKQKMEKYYEEYIHSAINDDDEKYGKFSEIFPGRQYISRLALLQDALDQMEIDETFSSIIDLDVYFFGLIYTVLFLKKSINKEGVEQLRNDIKIKISDFKSNSQHVRTPGHLKYLRERISSSINLYEKYVA